MKTAKTRTCYVFIFEGFSDWESALVMPGLHLFTDVEVKTVSVDGKPVTTLGNLTVVPDTSLAQVTDKDIDLLILPGGNDWEKGGNLEIKPLVDRMLQTNKGVAAICGATIFLAQQGYLETVPHTSNHLGYMKSVAPEYKGDTFYLEKPAVQADNLITASGTAMIQFAYEIFRYLDVSENENLKFWFNFFLDTLPKREAFH
ncbi:type 1 glutamine amidotransferase family protein [Rapidithrix thailandica]|uniref:Type 1 glutamine amidotransferase family protein n=1 Tax=Rapidithrix thailandica TaxID=413964 RepID=A0AAW9SJE1_9BACT